MWLFTEIRPTSMSALWNTLTLIQWLTREEQREVLSGLLIAAMIVNQTKVVQQYSAYVNKLYYYYDDDDDDDDD